MYKRNELTNIINNSPFIFAMNGSNGQLPTEVTRIDIDSLTTALFTGNYEPILNKEKYGDVVIYGVFHLYISDKLMRTFRKLPGFMPITQYPWGKPKLKSEKGAIGIFRIFIDKNIPLIKENETEIYPCIVNTDSDKYMILKVTL